MKFFSPRTNGFYDSDDNPFMPDDVRKVSDETYHHLFAEHAAGKIIAANADGDPIAVDPPSLSPDAVVNAIRKWRNNLLAQSDWTQLADVPAALRKLWAPYRQALRDITNGLTDPKAVELRLEEAKSLMPIARPE